VQGADFHLRHGTTTTLVSLVTAPAHDLETAARRISALLGEAAPAIRHRIRGIHAEGPFLAAARCGAQDPEYMSDPDPELIDDLLAAAGGHLRMMTIAPERPGAIGAIDQLTRAGVIAAVGHTDATFGQAVEAIAAGATVATHLGNAMSPLHHREPGVVGACLTAPEVCCELIVDGHHLHPSFVRLAAASKGRDGVVLITDAMAASGAGDGRYRLGRLDVDVRDGVATLVDGGSLAGSTLTMDAAYRNSVAAGLDEVSASRAASLNPARLLGIDREVGSIEVGKRADLVVLDEGREVIAVIAAGDVVAGSLEQT
jgi:N-acetylglucosamine-6-phosphate deacetylase